MRWLASLWELKHNGRTLQLKHRVTFDILDGIVLVGFELQNKPVSTKVGEYKSWERIK
jgi:hypothetical protein